MSGTIDSHYYLGCGARNGKEREFVYCIQGNCIDRADTAGCNGKGFKSDGTSYTITAVDRHAVYDARENGNGNISPTITGDHNDRITDYTAVVFRRQRSDQFSEDDITCTQNARQHKDATDLIKDKYGLVRRLTPLEVERLQGYPDGYTDIGDWTDSKGKTHKGDADRPRYKALGNSIALPFWQWLAGRINKQFDRQPTMASLFDGIGGFPLVFLRTGAKPVWASEIDDFCIAVSTRRIAEQEKTQKIIYDTR